MHRGWKKGTKSWTIRLNSQKKKLRLVDNLLVSNKINIHPVSFKAHATVILPFKSFDTGIDAIISEEYATKVLGKTEEFFKSMTLHHDIDGTLMYVDRELHRSKRHLGYRFIQLQKARKELGLE